MLSHCCDRVTGSYASDCIIVAHITGCCLVGDSSVAVVGLHKHTSLLLVLNIIQMFGKIRRLKSTATVVALRLSGALNQQVHSNNVEINVISLSGIY